VAFFLVLTAFGITTNSTAYDVLAVMVYIKSLLMLYRLFSNLLEFTSYPPSRGDGNINMKYKQPSILIKIHSHICAEYFFVLETINYLSYWSGIIKEIVSKSRTSGRGG